MTGASELRVGMWVVSGVPGAAQGLLVGLPDVCSHVSNGPTRP